MIYCGIDPGKSGAIAMTDGSHVEWILNRETEHDIWDWFKSWDPVCAVIERVGARPGQGVSSMFAFGQSYGFLRGLLVANTVRFDTVTPATWQGVMKCRSRGDKNVTKSRCQQLYPAFKITHANADAILIAHYCYEVSQ